MNTNKKPQYERIQRVGRLLWGFSWFWFIFNLLALLIAIATVVGLGVAGSKGDFEQVAKVFTHAHLIPGLDPSVMSEIVKWDLQEYLDHFWLTLLYITGALVYFVATMVFIFKIAAAWKRGDVLGNSPIRSFRILGWIYLIHGIVSQVWGMAGQFMGNTHTYELVYFSFIRDVCFRSCFTSGSGIEWGILVIAISWILKYAQEMREDLQLTI